MSLQRMAHALRLRFDSAFGRVEAAGRELAREIDWRDLRPDRPTVLCLKRSTFIKDVEDIRRRGNFNLPLVRAARVKHAQEPWVAPEDRRQTYFYHFLQTRLAPARADLARFALAFLKEALKTHPIDAVFAGNTDYWQDESVKIACKTLGIPFLVLGRENYSMGIDAINVLNRFRSANFRFNGAGVAVYSEATQRTMIDSGSFPEGAVWVTGAPRFDHWIDLKPLPDPERDMIMLINYSYPEGYLAPQNFIETAKLFAAAAKRAPKDIVFALKSKKFDEEADARRLVPELNEAPIQYLCSEPLVDLYPRCRAVIGVNSLAVAEAFLAETAVIAPFWGDARREPAECLLLRDDPDDVAATYFADSPEELVALLDRAAARDLPPKGDKAFRRKRFCRHIALPDEGTCADQVERYINHFIAAARDTAARNAA